jgi:hypothetical protein
MVFGGAFKIWTIAMAELRFKPRQSGSRTPALEEFHPWHGCTITMGGKV